MLAKRDKSIIWLETAQKKQTETDVPDKTKPLICSGFVVLKRFLPEMCKSCAPITTRTTPVDRQASMAFSVRLWL